MNRRVGVGSVAALAFVMAVAGCGGGGSNSLSPGAVVQSRARALDSAMTGGDVSSVMAFYSENYQGEDGETKADVQTDTEEMFSTSDVISITVTAEQFTITPSGGQVIVDGDYTIVLEDKITGEQGTFTTTTTTTWQKEGDNWRIVSVSAGELVQVAGAARGDRAARKGFGPPKADSYVTGPAPKRSV